MPYASNNNAVLVSECNNLQDLSVCLQVTEDIATTDGKGWSFQLNCCPAGLQTSMSRPRSPASRAIRCRPGRSFRSRSEPTILAASLR